LHTTQETLLHLANLA